MLKNLQAIIQYLLPKQLLTQLAGCLASKQLGAVTTLLIKGFIKLYHVNMQEAQLTRAEDYKTFNDFFTRSLKTDARPIDEQADSLVMPADGVVSQFGTITEQQLIQAKGHEYSLNSLLAANQELVKLFENGTYVTTYLSPSDYHCVHMPCNAQLRQMIYVPGSLFSVNSVTTQMIPNIFARNERVICYFETEFGPMIQILVGATIVGSIETSWHGVVNASRDGVIKSWHYADVTLQKGERMGCFKLGSTVINLFADNRVTLNPELQPGAAVQMGQNLASKK